MKKRLLLYIPILFIAGYACTKNVAPSPYADYYGHWQWIESTTLGPWNLDAPPDSIIVLSLNAGNTYSVSLNGKLLRQGAFILDSVSGSLALNFPDITEPYGDSTSIVVGTVHIFQFNNFNIGKFVLYQKSAPFVYEDTLSVALFDIIPERPVSYYVRVR